MDAYIYQILKENVSTFAERDELEAVMEANHNAIEQEMTKELLKVMGRRRIDFGSIENSKGRLSKFEGYANLLGCINLLKNLYAHRSHLSLDILEKAHLNLLDLEDIFAKGFKLENSFIKLTYNVLVYSLMDAISCELMSIQVDNNGLLSKVDLPTNGVQHRPSYKTLQDFNVRCDTREMRRVLESALGSGKNNFVGGIGGAAVVLGISMCIIPMIRESIYVFYSSRIKVSDYLEQQATFLELEKLTVQDNASLSPAKKNKILAKQQKKVTQLRKISDKISVEYNIASKKAHQELTKENQGWDIKTVRDRANNSQQGQGFNLI